MRFQGSTYGVVERFALGETLVYSAVDVFTLNLVYRVLQILNLSINVHGLVHPNSFGIDPLRASLN